MHKICPNGLYKYSFVNNVKLSPNAERIAFIRSCPVADENAYRTELWVIDCNGKGLRCLHIGFGSRMITWLDCATMLCELPDQENGRYFTMDTNGIITPLLAQKGARSLQPLSNGQYVYLISQKPKQNTHVPMNDHCTYVFDELPFWTDGRGIRNKMRDVLMVHNTRSGCTQQISPNDMQVERIAVSPHADYLAFVGTSYDDVKPNASALYLYHLSSETLTMLESQMEGHVHPFLCFIGNDELLFAADHYRFLGSNPTLYRYCCTTGQRYALPFNDISFGGGLVTDVSYGDVNVSAVSDGVLYIASPIEHTSRLLQLEPNGTMHPIPHTKGILSFDVCGNTLAFSAVQRLPEIYIQRLPSGEPKPITHFNDDYSHTHSISQPIELPWCNRDKMAFTGWVIPPSKDNGNAHYPAVLAIHGGPLGVWDDSFNHEMQCLAAAGYFVLFTNPRGSSGRGEAFANLSGIAGTIDYEDLMDFLDHALKIFPRIDQSRLGLCGGSYGGFMCNWIIGHTTRFAAAVSQRSISNFFTKQLCADNGYTVTRALTNADPFADPEKLLALSPLNYANAIRTPTLFIQSDQDYCCWMCDSLQMYAALKSQGVDARLCLFHGESHGLSRIGKPANRIARLNEILDWFARFLKPNAQNPRSTN